MSQEGGGDKQPCLLDARIISYTEKRSEGEIRGRSGECTYGVSTVHSNMVAEQPQRKIGEIIIEEIILQEKDTDG